MTTLIALINLPSNTLLDKPSGWSSQALPLHPFPPPPVSPQPLAGRWGHGGCHVPSPARQPPASTAAEEHTRPLAIVSHQRRWLVTPPQRRDFSRQHPGGTACLVCSEIEKFTVGHLRNITCLFSSNTNRFCQRSLPFIIYHSPSL